MKFPKWPKKKPPEPEPEEALIIEGPWKPMEKKAG